jgi:hypothetical protein
VISSCKHMPHFVSPTLTAQFHQPTEHIRSKASQFYGPFLCLLGSYRGNIPGNTLEAFPNHISDPPNFQRLLEVETVAYVSPQSPVLLR